MQKKNIATATGTVYAYQPFSYSPSSPALVLDNTNLWKSRLPIGDTGATTHTIARDAKTARGSGIDVGFLVVTTARAYPTRDEAAAAAELLAELHVPDEITEATVDAFAFGLPDSLRVATHNYRRFTDTWTAAVAAEKATERAQAAIAAERRLRIEDNTRRWDAVRERLTAHGITPDIGDAAEQPGRVTVPLTLDELTTLLDAADR